MGTRDKGDGKGSKRDGNFAGDGRERNDGKMKIERRDKGRERRNIKHKEKGCEGKQE